MKQILTCDVCGHENTYGSGDFEPHKHGWVCMNNNDCISRLDWCNICQNYILDWEMFDSEKEICIECEKERIEYERWERNEKENR